MTFPSLGDPALVARPDIYAELAALLLSQDKESTTFKAFVKGLAAMDTILHESLFDLVTSGSLEGASGWLLDRWGVLVGEPRAGLLDRDYRRFIKAAVILNTSFGSLDEHTALWSALMGADIGEAKVEVVEMYPHGVSFYAYRNDLLPTEVARRAARMMRRSKPPGVAFRLVEARNRRYFGFSTHTASHAHAPPIGYDRGAFARAL